MVRCNRCLGGCCGITASTVYGFVGCSALLLEIWICNTLEIVSASSFPLLAFRSPHSASRCVNEKHQFVVLRTYASSMWKEGEGWHCLSYGVV